MDDGGHPDAAQADDDLGGRCRGIFAAHADEEGTLARIRALRSELIDPVISTNRGRIVNTAGDGVLVEFASVVDAVRAAIDVQHAMTIRNADFVPEKRIEFRAKESR